MKGRELIERQWRVCPLFNFRKYCGNDLASGYTLPICRSSCFKNDNSLWALVCMIHCTQNGIGSVTQKPDGALAI